MPGAPHGEQPGSQQQDDLIEGCGQTPLPSGMCPPPPIAAVPPSGIGSDLPTHDTQCELALGCSASVSATAGALAGDFPGATQLCGRCSGSTPPVCSDSVHHVGGHAAAFISPHVFDEDAGEFAHAPLRCASTAAVNPACEYENVQPSEAVVARHVLLAPPATASIFKRSALLSNLQRGPIGSSVGRASGLRPKATAHDFEHLSALALASEKVQAIIFETLPDGHFDSGL